MIELASAADIERELRLIGHNVTRPTRFTLFGGCAMSVQGLKAATKDTDIVVHGPTIQQLLADLHKAGYDPHEDPWTIDFDSYVIVGRPGGIRVDLFPPHRIFDGPGFIRSMDERATPWFEEGSLTARLADPTTIFLFKAITGRWRTEPTRDVEDLRRLLARNVVDWDVVRAEWPAFEVKGPRVVEKAREAVGILREAGYAVDWEP